MLRWMLKANKRRIRTLLERMQLASIRAASREQEMDKLSERLVKIVPDLTEQYTRFRVDTEFRRVKTRAQHALQIRLALRTLDFLADRKMLSIVDIGDSSGNHSIYLNSLISDDKRYNLSELRLFSVNLDPIAVEKIRSKGLTAFLCRAEDLYDKYQIKANVFLSFEMLEHLYDPISFLNIVSERSVCEYFVLTVPYLAQSRIGLHHIRQKQHREVYPENTHIFELSPTDWKLIFLHAGWEVVEEVIYRQYPLKSIGIFMKPLWKKLDFEGFYGAILKRNRNWAECYKHS